MKSLRSSLCCRCWYWQNPDSCCSGTKPGRARGTPGHTASCMGLLDASKSSAWRLCMQAAPENILSIVFARKACREMYTRVRDLHQDPAPPGYTVAFHGFCHGLIRRCKCTTAEH